MGSMASNRIPFRAVRMVTALLFAVMGVAALLGFGG
jgi:putative Ca2+/H+ antiporter (TMEM165/GDT1 family)